MQRTRSGFEYDLETEKLNDMRLIDLLASDEDDITSVSKILTLMFDKKDRERLYAHVSEDDGRVPIDKVSDEIADIFNEQGRQGKNY